MSHDENAITRPQVMVMQICVYEQHTYTKLLLYCVEKKKTFFCIEQKAVNAKIGHSIVFDGLPTFEKNVDKLTQKQWRFKIWLLENVKITTTRSNNKCIRGTVTDNRNAKFYCFLPNFGLDELVLFWGVIKVNPDESFEARGFGQVMNIKKNMAHDHPIIEEKRQEFRVPNKHVQITSKNIITVSSVEEFVDATNGKKQKTYSNVLRVFVKCTEFKNVLLRNSVTNELYWNGTVYIASDANKKTIRVKVKNNVMRDVIMLKPASEANNFAQDLELLMDVEERIDDCFWDIELMYSYSEEKAMGPKPVKRRKLNNGSAPQCRSGYISIVAMKVPSTD